MTKWLLITAAAAWFANRQGWLAGHAAGQNPSGTDYTFPNPDLPSPVLASYDQVPSVMPAGSTTSLSV